MRADLMEVISSADLGDANWDTFCSSSPDAWFWHTTAWRDYSLAYAGGREPRIHSFAVVDGRKVLAICPVASEAAGGGERELLYGGGPCPAPALAEGLPARQGQAILERVVAELDVIAAAERARRLTVRRTPLARAGTRLDREPLIDLGFIDVSLGTRVVELLGRDEADLWRDVRHGHRYDIRRGERMLDVAVIDEGRFDPAVFEGYVELHRRAAGRVTRARRTFDLMAEWITQGRAALFLASADGGLVGAAYVIHHGNAAFYASAANDPDRPGVPAGHVLQWRILRWLRERGIHRYDLGLQPDGVLLHAGSTEKERAIGRFKRGFGGVTVPLVVLERYYSEAFFRAELGARVDSYAGSWLAARGAGGPDPAAP